MMERETSIAERATPLRKGPLSYIDTFIKAIPDLWSPENPEGWIAVVVAENKLDYGNKAFLTKMNEVSVSELGVMNYGNMKGWPPLQQALCDLMNRTFAPQVDLNPSNLIILSGCSSIIDSLAFCICNPGEGVLIPQPSYAAFDNDLKARSHLVPVELPLSDRGEDIFEQLDDAVSRAQENGVKITALLITNPNNPLGTMYRDSTIEDMIQWCMKNKIHYISDEIYALSVHEPGMTFTSALCKVEAMIHENKISRHDAKEYFHTIYGLSKDWCASGLRIGCLYSDNSHLQEAMNSLAPFGGVSNYQQQVLAEVLSDTTWTETFLTENIKTVRQSYEILTRGLDTMNIAYQPATAGIFLWADMRQFLTEASWEGERALWNSICDSCKVILTPGESCHAQEPGYFRICYASVLPRALEVMIERLGHFFNQNKGPLGP